jgi:hypothetical protein
MTALLTPSGAGAVTRKPVAAAKPAVPTVMQSCDAHKFETVVQATVDGQPRESKVKLCGVEGQSNEDWVRTLKDAIQKLHANKDMAAAVRDQIISAINLEIARLSIVGSLPAPLRTGNAAPKAEPPLSRDYSTLPPLPAPQVSDAAPPPADNPVSPARSAVEPPVKQEFAQLPPLPAAPTTVVAPVASRPLPIPAAAPRLTFGCDTPGDLTSDAPCADFRRDTTLTVHAREEVPAGTFLQFVRNDQSQAELALGGLRRGKALRTALPAEVCRGFTSGKLELRIVRGESGSEVLSTEGPYTLRC